MSFALEADVSVRRLLLVLSTAFIGCGITTTAVTGHVLDDSTGKAIPSAILVVRDSQGMELDRRGAEPIQTTPCGRYRIGTIEPGTYSIRFMALGWISQERVLTVDSTHPDTLDVRLPRVSPEIDARMFHERLRQPC